MDDEMAGMDAGMDAGLGADMDADLGADSDMEEPEADALGAVGRSKR
jgi:hypothetical protein